MLVDDVKTVVVVGAGTMGSVIAGEFARAGCEARLVDVNAGALKAGMEKVRAAQQVQVEAGLLSAEGAREAVGRMRPTEDLEAGCAGADVLVEAVSENLAVKQEMFRKFEAFCPERAVFATNTSGLSITEMGRVLKRPERLGGMHFWNPPHIIPLVEVTRGKATSDAVAELLMGVCRRLGKRPILVRHEVPGFVGNRLQFAVMREALHLLSEGVASAEDIDAAMSMGPGLRYGLLGPLRTADLGGLDVFLAISRYLFADLHSSPEAPEVLEKLVSEGRLGAKTGAGFYRYGAEDLEAFLARRDRVLLGFMEVLKREGDA